VHVPGYKVVYADAVCSRRCIATVQNRRTFSLTCKPSTCSTSIGLLIHLTSCLETTVQADSTEFDVLSAIKMIGPSINHALFGDSSIATVSRGMSMGSRFSVACILFEHPLQCFAKVFRVGSCIREASSFRVYLSATGNGTSYKSAF